MEKTRNEGWWRSWRLCGANQSGNGSRNGRYCKGSGGQRPAVRRFASEKMRRNGVAGPRPPSQPEGQNPICETRKEQAKRDGDGRPLKRALLGFFPFILSGRPSCRFSVFAGDGRLRVGPTRDCSASQEIPPDYEPCHSQMCSGRGQGQRGDGRWGFSPVCPSASAGGEITPLAVGLRDWTTRCKPPLWPDPILLEWWNVPLFCKKENGNSVALARLAKQ